MIDGEQVAAIAAVLDARPEKQVVVEVQEEEEMQAIREDFQALREEEQRREEERKKCPMPRPMGLIGEIWRRGGVSTGREPKEDSGAKTG